MSRSPRVASGLLLLAAAAAWAGEVRTFVESPASLGQGTSAGVAVTDHGRMFLSPEIARLGETSRNGPAHVWALIPDDQGNLYLGTGPDGEILRSTSTGKQERFFRVDEPMVTALAWASDGDLLAGTAPHGRIYKIGSGGRGAVWAETGERYVWSLWVGGDGRVLAGTGEAGRILVLDPGGEIDLFYDSDEAHIVRLTGMADGTLVAGGAGRGRVYQIDGEGHAHVLHDDDLAEVTGLAVLPDGHVVASLLAPPEARPRRPAVRIQLPDDAVADPGAAGGLTDLDEERPTIEGFIEGLPEAPATAEAGTRGRVIRISPDGAVTELWKSSVEAPLSLALDADGRVVFGTGEPARIWRVEPQGDVALLSTAREAQVTAIAAAGRWLAAATSNPAGIYRIERRTPETGLFHSRPIDAGGPARWGRIAWNQRGTGGVEFYTRTGNSSRPDETWSAWSPALTSPGGSPIVNPDGRFLQWRARLLGGGEGHEPVSGVQVTYAPYNRAPEIEGFRVEPMHGAVKGEAVVRLRARDPDGDPLLLELQYRRAGAEWRTAIASDPDEAVGDDWRRWRDERIAWDTTALDEGSYEVRAVASDRGSNAPDEGLERSAGEDTRVIVDRTAPQLEIETLPGGGVRVEVRDERSGVRRLELMKNGRVRFSARPEDGVCDSRRERFELSASDVGGDGWTLRAVDAAGNDAERPLRAS